MQTKVLIAEDNDDLRVAIVEYLREAGFKVFSSADGKDFLTRFRSEKPHAVILDSDLPDVSGIELCRLVRIESNCPVLMFSGHIDQGLIDDAYTAGITDYVPKSRGVTELVARTMLAIES